MNKSVHIIMTGGTIDSSYNGIIDTVQPMKKSVLPEYFSSVKPYADIQFTQVCMKDSRELNKNDRAALLKVIESSKIRRIIVTHGTYTMPDTARYVAAHLKRHDQTIVVTGSMIPIDGFRLSDAGFNLGFAMAKVQSLGPGIYVTMNARIFSPEETIKELNKGRFNSIFSN